MVILLWKINYFRILKIIRIIGKFRKCGIISSLLICEFVKIFWDIFEYFNVENSFYWIIGNVGIVEIIEKFWKLWHSFASWLCEERIKIVKSV